MDWHPLQEAHNRIPAVSGVYVIRLRSTGMEYVGISKNMRQRVMRHRTRQAKDSRLYRAIAVHGLDAFDAAVWRAANVDDLPALEVEAIAARESFSPAGFNLTRGGGIIHTAEHSAERRAQAAETARRTHLGRKRSEQTKARLSASLRGRRLSPERVQRLADLARGRKIPDTTRAALRASRLRPVWVWPVGGTVPLEFGSVQEAVAYVGRPHASVLRWLKKGSPAGVPALAYAE